MSSHSGWTVEQVKLMGKLRQTGLTEERLIQLYREVEKYDKEDSLSLRRSPGSMENSDQEVYYLNGTNCLTTSITDEGGRGGKDVDGLEEEDEATVKSNAETISSIVFERGERKEIGPCSTRCSTSFHSMAAKSDRERQIAVYQQELANMTRDLCMVERELTEKVVVLERDKMELQMFLETEKTRFTAELNNRERLLREKDNVIEDLREEERKLANEKELLVGEKERLEKELRRESDDNQRKIECLKEEINEVTLKKQQITEDKNFLLIQLRQLEEEKLTIAKTLQLTNDKLSNLSNKCDELKQENSELRRLIERHEQDKEFKDDEIHDLRRKLEMVENELEVCKKDLNESQAHLSEEEKTSEKLTKELHDVTQTLKEVEKSRSELKKEVKSLKMAKSQLENEIGEKRSEIEELNQVIERQTEKERQRQAESNKDKAILVEIEAEKQMVKKENVSLKHRISELEHLLKLEKNTSKKKEEEIKRLDNVKTNLESKLVKASEEISSHVKSQRELESKVKQNDSLANRLMSEKKEIEEHLVKLNSVLRSCLKLGNVTLNESDITFDEIVPSKNRKSYLLSSLIDTELLDAEFVRSAIIDLLSKVEALSKERDDLKACLESAEHLSNSIKEGNRNLKFKAEKLENDLNKLEKDNKVMSRKIEDAAITIQKLEEMLEKSNSERKTLAHRVENMEAQCEKLEKDKRKLMHELNSQKSVKVMVEKDFNETKERYESKIKKLEATKDSLDSRISTLIKNCNQLTEEKESLIQELKMVNGKLIELQNHNYKLHSALNESNMALKRSSDGEKDLKKRVNNLTDSVEQHDIVTKDVHKQVRRLKEQIQELKSEKSALQSTIETDRHSIVQSKENIAQLQLRVKQLEAELNLSNIKRKEAEFQQTILTNGNIDKEARIKELKSELAALEEKNKHLLVNQKTMEKSFSVSSINRKNANKIAEETMKDKSSFVDETTLTTKGLKALEDENIKLQRKVKSLQNLMNEATGNQTAANNDLARLREAQKQAEDLLQSKEKSNTMNRKSATSRVDVNGQQHQLSTNEITSTPTRLKTSTRTIQECTRSERTQITSTPVQPSSACRFHSAPKLNGTSTKQQSN